jgi:molybdate transport system substrate-binding protein
MALAVRSLVPLLAAAVLAGCGADGTDDGRAPGNSSGPSLRGTITVFAAASLTDAFQRLGNDFEAVHPGVSVRFSFGGSSALREQILSGAPADVFASANESNMQAVVDAGAVAGRATPFVTNQLQIAVPGDNPGRVTGLADFARPDLLIGLCAEEVPCGEFGREALSKAGVEPSVDTNEADVRSLLTKIEAGELDAGIVYRTDVLAAGDKLRGIEIPAEQNVVAVYPVASLSASKDPAAASAFVSYLLSPKGQATLKSFGFGPPT